MCEPVSLSLHMHYTQNTIKQKKYITFILII